MTKVNFVDKGNIVRGTVVIEDQILDYLKDIIELAIKNKYLFEGTMLFIDPSEDGTIVDLVILRQNFPDDISDFIDIFTGENLSDIGDI